MADYNSAYTGAQIDEAIGEVLTKAESWDNKASLVDGKVPEAQLPEIPDSLADFGVTATATELNYCDGVTSNIQAQFNATNAAIPTSLTEFGVTATATELNYCDGLTGNIQEQIANCANLTLSNVSDESFNAKLLDAGIKKIIVGSGSKSGSSLTSSQITINITVDLGFKPKVVLLATKTSSSTDYNSVKMLEEDSFTDTGFGYTMKATGSGSGGIYSLTVYYQYIAFE